MECCIFCLKDKLETKEVDWLSWEDPFILDKDPQQYKAAREKDPRELNKRMNYVLPTIRYLFEEYKNFSHIH